MRLVMYDIYSIFCQNFGFESRICKSYRLQYLSFGLSLSHFNKPVLLKMGRVSFIR
jgi:hypothetical protein